MVLILMEEGQVSKVNGSDFCGCRECSVSIYELNLSPDGKISFWVCERLKWDGCDM